MRTSQTWPPGQAVQFTWSHPHARADGAPTQTDPGSPVRPGSGSRARVYDALCGGKDHHVADREICQVLWGLYPELPGAVADDQTCVRQVTRWLSRYGGIDQAIVCGTGMPPQVSVHDDLARHQHSPRIVYVDIDPVVLTHARALLATGPGVAVLDADITDPAAVLAHPTTTSVINPAAPVGMLYPWTGHTIDDAAMRRAAITTTAAAAGSYLVVTQLAAVDEDTATRATGLLNQLGLPWTIRTRPCIGELLSQPGLCEIEPVYDAHDTATPSPAPYERPPGGGTDGRLFTHMTVLFHLPEGNPA